MRLETQDLQSLIHTDHLITVTTFIDRCTKEKTSTSSMNVNMLYGALTARSTKYLRKQSVITVSLTYGSRPTPPSLPHEI